MCIKREDRNNCCESHAIKNGKTSRAIQRPYPVFKGKTYEVDEMFTYVKHKNNRICIAYSFEVGTENIIDFVVGRRNKINSKESD